MIFALLVLLGCQLAGELLARLFHLPLPGPVLGMLLLFALLMARGALLHRVRDTAQGFLRYLPLLFVPAGVGLIRHGARLRAELWALLSAIVLSTVLTLAVSALAFQLVARALKVPEERK